MKLLGQYSFKKTIRPPSSLIRFDARTIFTWHVLSNDRMSVYMEEKQFHLQDFSYRIDSDYLVIEANDKTHHFLKISCTSINIYGDELI